MEQNVFEQTRTIKASNPIPQDDYQFEDEAVPENELDNPEAQERLKKLLAWWIQERDFQSDSRGEQATDADFYDHLQWRDEDKAALEERGQLPLVFNKSKIVCDWLIGTERKVKFDFNLFPRRADAAPIANVKSDFLKYLSDVNKSPFHRSRAFKDAVVVGVGWLEDGIREDITDELIYSRYESWKNMWWDHLSVENDLSDARYIFRTKWFDEDIACSMFPDRAEKIKSSVKANYGSFDEVEDWWNARTTKQSDGTIVRGNVSYDNSGQSVFTRNRVRLVECWYREPAAVKVLHGNGQNIGAFNNRVFNDQHDYMRFLLERGMASTYDAIKMMVRCAVFIGDVNDVPMLSSDMTGAILLQDMPSPYAHNRFPFTPIWAYKRQRDGMPYGVMRGLRDIQEDMNKRHSKSLFILSTNKVVVDNNAVDDWDELQREVSRPDGIIKIKPNSRLEINVDRDLASGHVQMLDRDAAFIEQVSGVTDENLGRQTNAISGKAIMSRAEQGSTVNTEIFDNYRFAFNLQGELQLSLMEQFVTEERQLRVTGAKAEDVKFIPINQQTPEGEILNDITSDMADFVVDRTEFRESARVALFETIMNLLGQMPPEISMQLLDLAIDLTDIPQKKQFIERIQGINGTKPPEEKTPEEQQAEQEQQAQQQRQLEASISLVEGQAKEKHANAQKVAAETQKIGAETVLTGEEVKSEQVSQMTKMRQADVHEEKLKIGKATAAANIVKAAQPPRPFNGPPK